MSGRCRDVLVRESAVGAGRAGALHRAEPRAAGGGRGEARQPERGLVGAAGRGRQVET